MLLGHDPKPISRSCLWLTQLDDRSFFKSRPNRARSLGEGPWPVGIPGGLVRAPPRLSATPCYVEVVDGVDRQRAEADAEITAEPIFPGATRAVVLRVSADCPSAARWTVPMVTRYFTAVVYFKRVFGSRRRRCRRSRSESVLSLKFRIVSVCTPSPHPPKRLMPSSHTGRKPTSARVTSPLSARVCP